MRTRQMLAVVTVLLFLPNHACANTTGEGAASLAQRPPPGAVVTPDSIETLIGRWSGGADPRRA
jgi:hypothetical protein